MNTQFFCKNKDRVKEVSTRKDQYGNFISNGIDYLEVSETDQRILYIHFLHNMPGQPGGGSPLSSPPGGFELKAGNFFIEGGVRVKNVIVEKIKVKDEKTLELTVDKAGDFSTYRLMIGISNASPDTPPPGFDELLSAIDFSFKINCPAEFDCKQETVCPPEKLDEPDIDYLAKDYSSFNRLMLDRLSIIMPDWKERNAADLQVAIIELLAYAGDHLSYYQDAVATEAYLEKARRRISMRRHARLLDYTVHDGCNARVWIHVEISKNGAAENQPIPERTMLLTNGDEAVYAIKEINKDAFIIKKDPVVFETMYPLTLHSSHNRISFYTWENSACCLPKGSTTASLLNEPALWLEAGDVLIFEELYSPETGRKADRNISHRHAVRLASVQKRTDSLTGKNILNISWYLSDALPFAMVVTSDIANEDADIPVFEKCVALGNVVLADHGISTSGKSLIPASPTMDEKYYPRLPDGNITVTVAYDREVEKHNGASVTIIQDPHEALPFVTLVDQGGTTWEAKQDLLGSDKFATEFVVETEQDNTSYLRFGDDILGKKPTDLFNPEVIYRVGNGREGNIGPESINTIVWDPGGIALIRNPMAAMGAVNPETMEEIRQFAPQAFRTQQRAVTEADYVAKTELHPEVQKAAARFYWTGSWYTVYIIVDRKGGAPIDTAFRNDIIKYLEQYRMAGYDLEIKGPVFVPLSIILNVCVKPGYFSSNVKQSLLEAFSSHELADGTSGFFHPDNFTFGQPVYLSSIYETAMKIAGVASVEVMEFKRWARNSADEIHQGILQPAELEIIRLDNDPSLPENGKITFNMNGGL